jgi:hypothetical protein
MIALLKAGRRLLTSSWANSGFSRLLKTRRFPGTAFYWEQRYRSGGNSGCGSYGHLADWKADVVNDFVGTRGVLRILEHGVGDGNQLSLARYSEYLGLDVSCSAINLCKKRFRGDTSKRFKHVDEYDGEIYDLALSMDVIFHLVEDDLYAEYMKRLFKSASHWVIVYASNYNATSSAPHVRHRRFTDYVADNEPDWKLTRVVRNKFPFNKQHPDQTSFSDFYFFEKAGKEIGA